MQENPFEFEEKPDEQNASTSNTSMEVDSQHEVYLISLKTKFGIRE
jgi:hypothetical protein